MEFLPGGNLAELLYQDDVDVTPLIALQFCLEIVNGLAHLHTISTRAELVHGDIKSENILLDGNLHCKIADFGGARIKLHTVSKSKTEDTEKKRQFTELYAAPELLENISMVMKSSHDVFSYSIVVYEIIERRKPIFMAQQLDIYVQQIKEGIRPNIDVSTARKRELEEAGRREDSNIIDVLVNTMENCWNQNPSSRPTMTEVQTDLIEFSKQIDTSRLAKDIIAAKNSCEMIMFVKNNPKQTLISINKLNPPFFDDDLGMKILANFLCYFYYCRFAFGLGLEKHSAFGLMQGMYQKSSIFKLIGQLIY